MNFLFGTVTNPMEKLPILQAGIVREVYCIEKWLLAGSTPTTRPPEEVNRLDRWEFVGKVAGESIRKKYLLKSVEMYFSKQSRNPITYITC